MDRYRLYETSLTFPSFFYTYLLSHASSCPSETSRWIIFTYYRNRKCPLPQIRVCMRQITREYPPQNLLPASTPFSFSYPRVPSYRDLITRAYPPFPVVDPPPNLFPRSYPHPHYPPPPRCRLHVAFMSPMAPRCCRLRQPPLLPRPVSHSLILNG